MPFSEQHADIACNFFEGLLKHTLDEWYGKRFLLVPWQEDALRQIFGWLDVDGSRLITMAYLELPKKTGKTEFAAGLALMALVLDSKPGCQVYGAAAAQRQAMHVFRASCKMVEQSPILSKRLRIMRGTNRIIKRNDPDSFYAAIAADGDLTDGVNPSCVIADEIHRWRTRKHLENWDVLSLGGIARKQTQTIAITTAGVQNESPLAWRYHEKTRKIAEGVGEDPHFYGRIYGADPKDDWTKEETWIKANPSLKQNGGFLDLAKIRAVYESSLTNPDEQIAFRRYYLNIWDQKQERAINMQQWHACDGGWRSHGLLPKPPEDKVRPLHEELTRRFLERPCWAGIDLSMTTDMSAITLVFPREEEGYDLLPFYYMPQDGLKKAELRDGMPYRRWAEEGFIETHPGNAIDYAEIRARLLWAARMFDLQEMCFDRYNSREMSTQLLTEGFPCVEVPQIFTGLSEATKKFLRLVVTGGIGHGGHPVLTWNASCLCLKSDGNDLVRPIKPLREKESARIDGVSAGITAIARALIHEKQVSIYDREDRGLLVI